MLRITQSLSLQQKMAPQLIQSLQLLQMSTLELELKIKQEMEFNPMLEEGAELELEEDVEVQEESVVGDLDAGLKAEAEVPEPKEEEVNWDRILDDISDSGSYNSEQAEYDPDFESDREPRENRITTVPPLIEQLQEQLVLSDLELEDREIGEFIIGNIDERGYLGCSAEDIAESLGVEAADVESILAVIHTFDPPGIGARDLRESLLIQLRQVTDPSRNLALQVVGEFMEDLTKRRFSRITRALGVSDEELRQVMELIETLQPHPGSVSVSDYADLLTIDTEVSYVTPDLIVEKIGDEWVVSLADGTLPGLRINDTYQQLLKDTRSKGKEEVKQYVSRKLNDARWLINAIHQRRATMLKVGNYIVHKQINFFERGSGHLKPMVLQDVADAVEMHVSTISRVSNGKYMQTPHGVFELKYFFDSKVSTDAGEDVSARSVKEKISTLISGEDKSKPLSDQEIADVLGEDGLQIARRTVAKYRDQLGINSQRYRKAL
jgi:RNA polymerase sigma-54 factor